MENGERRDPVDRADDKGEGFGARLQLALGALALLVKTLPADRFSGTDACRLVELFAWGERLCATGKALAARRVVDTGAWEASGERTGADWLANVTGQTPGQAAATLANARRLRSQPDVDDAARAGKLSPEQTTAVSAAAAKAPEKTQELLHRAESDTLPALRDRSRDIQLAADEAAELDRHKAIHASRYLRFWSEIDGSARLSGRFTPDQLAVIANSLVPFQEEVFQTARQQGVRERRECHAADALVAMAEAATSDLDDDDHDGEILDLDGEDLDGEDIDGDDDELRGEGDRSRRAAAPVEFLSAAVGDGTEEGGTGRSRLAAGRPPSDERGVAHQGTTSEPPDGRRRAGGAFPPAASNDPCRPPPDGWRRRSARRRPATTIIRIDLAALQRGFRTTDEVCEIEGVGTVAVATARAMMPESFLSAVITDGVDIRTVVHLGRKATARQRTALMARDVECVVPGCHVRDRLEIDHVADWTYTKVTRVDALARLCHYHHFQKTSGEFQLGGAPGRWTWIPISKSRSAAPENPPDGACGGPDGGGADARDDHCVSDRSRDGLVGASGRGDPPGHGAGCLFV